MQILATRVAPERHHHTPSTDSASNATVLDEVDFGRFKPDKIFSQDNAAILAALATASYSSGEHQKTHLDTQPAVLKFQFLDSKNNASLGINAPDTNTQVSLVSTPGALLVAARGTTPPWDAADSGGDSEWKDFQEDLKAVPVNNYDDSGKIHKGFKDAADGIWDQLRPNLLAAITAHQAIHLSGHSLGAAVALDLADRMMVEMHTKPNTIIRMGGPDVGWEDEKNHLEEVGLADRTYNFINCTDPVPHLLPGGVAAGVEVYLNRKGQVDLSGRSHKLDQTLGGVEDVFHGHLDPTHHHHPRYYNEHIEDPANAAILKQLER